METADELARYYRVVAANSTRLEILREIWECPRTPSELGVLLMQQRNTIQQHLRVLRDEGIAAPDASGRYRLADPKKLERLRRGSPEFFPEPAALPED